jgi:4-hydroxyacetophenone monooxygenase
MPEHALSTSTADPQIRNPHAGIPFSDSEDVIAAALRDVSVPALCCSLVHMTGNLSWVGDLTLPKLAGSGEYQCGLTQAEQDEVRARALPVIAAYRDGGCEPYPLSREDLLKMMSFLATTPLDGVRLGTMLLEDLQYDGADARAIAWGDEIPAEVKADAPVLVIGAGESGILAGIRLRQAGLPFTIVDKNEGPGGTWWENRYPGARVDVGSHQYCYSFEPSHHWSEYYCRHPELRAYFADVVTKYGLSTHCRFGTTVDSLVWDEQSARWNVTISGPAGSESLHARFVISAVGSLNLPKLPEIPGMNDFKGPSFHSTRWPEELDLSGVRFALIGAGASGFQIAPTIAPEVRNLTIFQRTAQWMIPNPLYRSPVPAGDRWAQRHLPFYARWFRFLQTYPGMSVELATYRSDPTYPHLDGYAVNETNAERRRLLEGWIRSQLGDRVDLIEKSIPDYPAIGKRVLQDDGFWLRSLKEPNVELVRTPIERITDNGVITTDGELREADVICYATGFKHNDFLASMSVIGRGGADLREQWGDEPTAYLGVTMPNFPNLFAVYGPGTNLAHSSSLFFHSEYQVGHAMDAIHAVLSAGAREIEVREDAHDKYAEWHQAEISQLVWAHPSVKHSHYKNPAGKVYTLSPWAVDHYWELTRHFDPGVYVIR